MGKEKKVITLGAIAKKPPVAATVLYLTTLKVFNAPDIIWGIVIALIALAWFGYFYSVFNSKEVDPFEESNTESEQKDQNIFQQKIEKLKNENR